jgi:phage terminase small subunit
MAYIDEETAKLIFKGIRSEKQRLFIQYYCNPESPTFDNGTQSYIKAYDSKKENVAAVEAHRLLSRETFKVAIDSYRAYLHEYIGFELDWLDINLRNLYYRSKTAANERTELAVLKAIGDRIGAFQDQHEDAKGITVPLTPDEERICNKVMEQIITAKKLKNMKKPHKPVDITDIITLDGDIPEA